MSEMTILTVDDDPNLLQFLAVNLESRGFRVLQAHDGVEALQIFAEHQPDLIILDLVMPNLDGWSVCRQIRETSVVPIIVLSARGDEEGKVKALRLGADDYLTKPFGVAELLARIRAVLRRALPATAEQRRSDRDIALGPLKIDSETRTVEWKQEMIHLTPIEYNLLYELASNAPRVLSHDDLLARIWGPEYEGKHHYVHIYVGRLRAKLGEQAIVTTPGIGYRFGVRPGDLNN